MAGAALAVIGIVTWLVWPSDGEPRARQYRDVSACLLTDPQGVAGTDAAPVWAGMQDASLETHGQVRYLAVAGEQSVGNATTFLGSLMVGRCAVIVAAGRLPVQAVLSVAAKYPRQQFIVAGTASAHPGNVSIVSTVDKNAERVAIATEVSHSLASS